ncbi:MAG: Methyltransferase type 11 [Thermoleophilia bacterium]|nr:Methyltransferase type 11 [Thermoleophilia bacterium]MCZ4496047.1 Methyltransferase type 11 [Thermoleophilia bacterium]
MPHVDLNERYWDDYAHSYHLGHSNQLPTDVPTWSVWGTPEAEVGALGDFVGRDVVELGCGGAQFSIALARAGARCTAIDISSEQIALGQRLLDEAEAADGARPDVTLVVGDVETSSLPDASFDIAFSDYGASMFADPLRWVPEAVRMLRPGGRLVFSSTTPLLETCLPKGEGVVSDRMVRDYHGMHRLDDSRAVYFNLPYGAWIRLFRSCGLDIVDMIETRPADSIVETDYRTPNQVAWAKRWPAEMIWILEKPAG